MSASPAAVAAAVRHQMPLRPARHTFAPINFPLRVPQSLFTVFVRTDLARNRLYMLDDSAFAGLLNLTRLDLSYNKLSALDSLDVRAMKKLESLNISGNAGMNVEELRTRLHVSTNAVATKFCERGECSRGAGGVFRMHISLHSGN